MGRRLLLLNPAEDVALAHLGWIRREGKGRDGRALEIEVEGEGRGLEEIEARRRAQCECECGLAATGQNTVCSAVAGE